MRDILQRLIDGDVTPCEIDEAAEHVKDLRRALAVAMDALRIACEDIENWTVLDEHVFASARSVMSSADRHIAHERAEHYITLAEARRKEA